MPQLRILMLQLRPGTEIFLKNKKEDGGLGRLQFGRGEVGDSVTSFPVGLMRPGNQSCSGNTILWNVAAEGVQLVSVT